ncbi:MAG: IMP dehydrogenase [Patescibacteria group bacterium]
MNEKTGKNVTNRNLSKKLMRKIYPAFQTGYGSPLPRYSLDEVALTDGYSTIAPQEVDLTTECGIVSLATPLLTAPMDTVSGPDLGKAAFEVGVGNIIYRHKKPEVQLEWIQQVISHSPCLVHQPKILNPNDTLEDAADILQKHRYSTIPVVDAGKKLRGILFTKNAALKENASDAVTKWMTPLDKLITIKPSEKFEIVRSRLLSEHGCSILPVVDDGEIFHGMYFRKDCRPAAPAYHNGKPVTGMAVSVKPEDIERVKAGLELGVSLIVIDCSHGDCPAVINQVRQIVELAKNYGAAVIAGNVASIGGYLRLAEVGVDAVKVGIGSGSICTTSLVTGVGVPMWSLIRECAYAREYLFKKGLNAPIIIADGGINNTGQIVKALAAGASLCMAGKYFVPAQESLASVDVKAKAGDLVSYRGMASRGAIRDRSAIFRYGAGKCAPEGVEGKIECRGPLKIWWPEDRELICGGFSHVGAATIEDLHRIVNESPYIWSLLTPAGQLQMAPRV